VSERGIHGLLIALLLGHLLLLSSRPEARGSVLENFVLAAVGPIGRSVDALSGGLGGLAESLETRRALERENRELRREVETLRAKVVKLQGVEEALDRLENLSGYAGRPDQSFYVADVVLLDRASWLRTLVIYTGPERPEKNQPVVTADGLVGRVVVSSGAYARVQLVTDRSSAVSAMIGRTRRQGIVRGVTDSSLELTLIPKRAEVRPGDEVVTAGIDGVFPRGIPIGKVTAVENEPGLFHRIELEPAIDLSLLDQVYVLKLGTIPDLLRERWDGEVP